MCAFKQYPEPDEMFDTPQVIRIEENSGRCIIGYGVGISGRQYPSDLREIIPAPLEVTHKRHVACDRNLIAFIQKHDAILFDPTPPEEELHVLDTIGPIFGTEL